MAVETAGTQQRRVKDVGAVRRGDHDHVGAGFEAVHLHQDLVQRLLTLVVRSPQPGASLPADGVDLVDEDDGGSVTLRLVEEVAHAAGANAHEHLHELRTGDREEGHPGLAGDCPRQHRLAGAGRPHQQHPVRDTRAEGDELLRVLQELDHLGQLLLRLLLAGDVEKK